ncbi:MAG: hypothetical protein KF726_09875 [Anaerolineae bacterium]|nr:hypothetical protein [Anaerolineae bacterium]
MRMRILRLSFGSSFLFAALLALITVSVRGNEYECIRYTGFGLLDGALLDGATGGRFGAARPAVIPGTATMYARSPDGNWIAYTEPRANSTLLDLKLIKTLGVGRRIIYTYDANITNFNFRWSPDSKQLSAYESFNLENRSRFVTIPLDRPILVTELQGSGGGLYSYFDYSPDGRYLVTIEDQYPDTLVVTIWHPESMTPILTVQQDTALPPNMYQPYIWSRDSTRFATTFTSNGVSTLLILNPEEGTQQTFTLSKTGSGVMELVWSPDASRLAVITSADGGMTSLRSIEIITLAAKKQLIVTDTALAMTQADGTFLPYTAEWSVDSQTLYFLENHEERIVGDLISLKIDENSRLTLAKRLRYRPSFMLGGMWACVVAADDRADLVRLPPYEPLTIALSNGSWCVNPLSSSDGEMMVVPSYRSWNWVTREGETGALDPELVPLYWTPDSRWLIATGSSENYAESTNLYRIEVRTGETHLIMSGAVSMSSVSPDGKWVAAQKLVKGTAVLTITSIDGSQTYEHTLDSWLSSLRTQLVWAPDSSKLVFGYPTGTNNLTTYSGITVEVIDTKGTILRRFNSPPYIGDWTGVAETAHWTMCGSNVEMPAQS